MTRKSHLASLRLSGTAEKLRGLRGEMTDAETVLWYHLRGRRLLNHKIRRQVPVGTYVADFLCEGSRLIIEVDGGQHQEHAEADRLRTAWLERHGYRLIRFWNHDVLGNTSGVIEEIARALGDPLPGPPPRGRENS